MVPEKLMDFQNIARSNYHWNERKTRINLLLSAALLITLFGVIAYL